VEFHRIYGMKHERLNTEETAILARWLGQLL